MLLVCRSRVPFNGVRGSSQSGTRISRQPLGVSHAAQLATTAGAELHLPLASAADPASIDEVGIEGSALPSVHQGSELHRQPGEPVGHKQQPGHALLGGHHHYDNGICHVHGLR